MYSGIPIVVNSLFVILKKRKRRKNDTISKIEVGNRCRSLTNMA